MKRILFFIVMGMNAMNKCPNKKIHFSFALPAQGQTFTYLLESSNENNHSAGTPKITQYDWHAKTNREITCEEFMVATRSFNLDGKHPLLSKIQQDMKENNKTDHENLFARAQNLNVN